MSSFNVKFRLAYLMLKTVQQSIKVKASKAFTENVISILFVNDSISIVFVNKNPTGQSIIFDMHVDLAMYAAGIMKNSKRHFQNYNIVQIANFDDSKREKMERDRKLNVFPDQETFQKIQTLRDNLWMAANRCAAASGEKGGLILLDVEEKFGTKFSGT